MLEKKTSPSLADLVTGFQARQRERREKIEGRITDLQAEGEDLRGRIQAATAELVNVELAGNADQEAAINKALRELRSRLVEVEDLAEAFRAELKKPAATAPDLEEIRTVALAEYKARQDKLNDLAGERQGIEEQIRQLEAQLKDVEAEIERTRVDAEAHALSQILYYCVPRAKQVPVALSLYDRGKLLNHWIKGNQEGIDKVLAKHITETPAPEDNVVRLNQKVSETPDQPPQPAGQKIGSVDGRVRGNLGV